MAELTRAEAHVWIAVYASALPDRSPEAAITMADFSVKALREKEPETLAALTVAIDGCSEGS